MTDSNPPSPSDERDPAAANIEETQDEEKKAHKPRDSKGWDGKLRLTKKGAAPPDPDAPSEPEESDDEGPEPEQLAADEDLLDDMDVDETDIDLVHFRISSIPALRLERFKKLQVSITSSQ
jgi:protein phosphatase 1 regulatory subunit 7